MNDCLGKSEKECKAIDIASSSLTRTCLLPKPLESMEYVCTKTHVDEGTVY